MTVEVQKTDLRRLGQQARRVDARSKPLARQIARWFERVARLEVERTLATLEASGELERIASRGVVPANFSEPVKKADMSPELVALLTRFSFRQLRDSANLAAGKTIIRGRGLEEALLSRTPQVKVFDLWIHGVEQRVAAVSRDTSKMVNEAIRTLLQDALNEVPRPSAGEIARRIRSQAFGPDKKDRIFAFSSERAETVARTELVIALGQGAFEGYKAAGATHKTWWAYRDGRSGDREHHELHGVTIPIDEPFLTPLGNRLMFPGDPGAPIKDVIRCRCSLSRARAPRK